MSANMGVGSLNTGLTDVTTNNRYEASASRMFVLLLGVALASLVLNFQITYAILLVIYAEHILHRLLVTRSLRLNRYGKLFLAFLGIGVFFWLAHYENAAISTEFQRTLELIFIFCAFFMIADAIRYNLNRFNINYALFGISGLMLLPTFALLKLSYEYLVGNIPFIGLMTVIRGRHNALVWINPNHTDDIFLFLAIAVATFAILAWSRKKWRKIIIVLAGMGLAALLFFFCNSQSYSGFVGLIAGLCALAVAALIQQFDARVRIFWGISTVLLVLAGILAANSHSIMGTTGVQNTPAACSLVSPENNPEVRSMAVSVIKRQIMFQTAMEIWKESPVLGHGTYDPDIFQVANPEIEVCVLAAFAHTHSLYSDLLVRGGLVLLIVYTLVILQTGNSIFSGYWQSRGNAKILFSLLLVYFVYLVVENFFDLTFIVSSHLKATLMNYVVVLSIAFHLISNDTKTAHPASSGKIRQA